MKSYIKGFLFALIPTFIMLATLVSMNFIIYTYFREEFVKAFGITMTGPIIWGRVIMFGLVMEIFFGLLLKRDFEVKE